MILLALENMEHDGLVEIYIETGTGKKKRKCLMMIRLKPAQQQTNDDEKSDSGLSTGIIDASIDSDALDSVMNSAQSVGTNSNTKKRRRPPLNVVQLEPSR